jgi:hypothetical protein
MIAETLLVVTIFILLKVFKDLITHHDMFKYYKWGRFFWRETVYGEKKSLLHKYFPMFYDMWHLAEALQIFQLCAICAIHIDPSISVGYMIIATFVAYTVASIMFNFFYEALGNGH